MLAIQSSCSLLRRACALHCCSEMPPPQPCRFHTLVSNLPFSATALCLHVGLESGRGPDHSQKAALLSQADFDAFAGMQTLA